MSGRTRQRQTDPSGDGIHYKHESSVLKMPSKDAPDSSWNTFHLVDAIILEQDGKTPANPLNVQIGGPFIIRGYMKMTPDEDESYPGQRTQAIRKFHRRGEPIECLQSTQLSIGSIGWSGLGELGDPILWMRGNAAWYEIYPRPEYAAMYRKASEAILLYYGLLMVYESTVDKTTNRSRPKRIEGRKSTAGIERLRDVFAGYALKAGNGVTIEEIEKQCEEAAPLFVQWFISGAENHIWESTYFRQWMMQKHEGKDLVKRMQLAEKARLDMPTRQRPKSKTKVTLDEPIEATTLLRSTRSGSSSARSPPPASRKKVPKASRSSLDQSQTVAQAEPVATATPDQSMPDAPAEEQDPIDSVVAALENVHGQIWPKKELTPTSVASKLYFPYRWPTFKNGKPGCHKTPIQEVLQYNSSALLKRLDSAKWENSEFWTWLQEVSKTKLTLEALKPSDLPYTVVLRNTKTFTPRAPQLVQATSSSRADRSQSDDHHDSDEPETPRRPHRAGKTPVRQGKSTLRLPPSKRNFEELDSDSEEDSPVAKRLHHDDDDGLQEQEALSSDEEDKIKLVIRADRIPSTAPRGRDGTWTCDEDGCNYVVRGGDAEACQERIESHFKVHEHEGERLQLAVTEGTRGHLPINHLLEKIQQLGERAEAREERQQKEEYETTLPKPIKRRLLV